MNQTSIKNTSLITQIKTKFNIGQCSSQSKNIENLSLDQTKFNHFPLIPKPTTWRHEEEKVMRNRVDAESTDGYAAAAALVRAKDGSGFVRWYILTFPPFFFL